MADEFKIRQKILFSYKLFHFATRLLLQDGSVQQFPQSHSGLRHRYLQIVKLHMKTSLTNYDRRKPHQLLLTMLLNLHARVVWMEKL